MAALASSAVHAFPNGITGRSGNPAPSAGGGETCAECHVNSAFNYNVGTISGTTTVAPSSLNAYTLNFAKAAGTTATRAGFNLSATGGTLGDPNTGASPVQKLSAELTHSSPAVPAGDGSFAWNFTWTAPASAGSYRFYFCNNPVNFNSSNTGDGAIKCGFADITVTPPPPAPPVANNDSYGVEEDVARTVAAPGVLANDTDVNGDTLTAVLVNGPTDGNLTLNADGSFTYTPDASFIGTDTFTYQANDGNESSGTATVTLNVAPNTAPVATNDSYAASRNTLRVVAAPGVLVNDTDAEDHDLTAAIVAGATNGTVTLNADGGFSYTPDADFTGADTFTYQASDGIDTSNTATVTITVSAPSTGGGGGGGGGGAPGVPMLALLALAAYVRGLKAGKRRAISP